VRIAIVLGIFVALLSSSTFANDKSAADTAYCIGVHQHDIEIVKMGVGRATALEKAQLKELVLKKDRLEAGLQQAIKQKQVEYVVASKMTLAGFADSKKCTEKAQCKVEAAKRINDNADEVVDESMTKDCERQFEPVCELAHKTCD
jgi:hypothetical protein